MSQPPETDKVTLPPDHPPRWVFIRRDTRTEEEIRRDRHDAIRRTWEPLGNSLSDRLKRLRREFFLWWS
jgi:hypothetical protein